MFKKSKPDEMDREISSKSVITAHYYTQFMLVGWIIICILKHRSVLMPLYVFLVGILARGVSSLIYRHDFGDERWKKGLVVILPAVAAVAFLLMSAFGFVSVGV